MLANMNTNYFASGRAPRRWGNAHPNLVPYQTFKASDQWIIVACGNDEQYRRFCEAGESPELASDSRFNRVQDRIRNRDALIPLLEAMVARRTAQYWTDALERAGVPCGPINDLPQVFDNPQVKARGLQIGIERDDAGTVPLVGNPVKYSATPPIYRRAPPRLGEHTAEVLSEVLGMSAAEIQRLVR
jgi:crotonobetainyl-CoA:carnitine CoA-transferase CaiB-like acyl-CoA transferase